MEQMKIQVQISWVGQSTRLKGAYSAHYLQTYGRFCNYNQMLQLPLLWASGHFRTNIVFFTLSWTISLLLSYCFMFFCPTQGYLYLPHPALSRKLKSPHRKSPKKSFFPRTAPKTKILWASLPFKVFCATTTKDYAWFAEITNHPQKAMTSFLTAPKSILQYKRCFLGDYHYQHTYTNTATPINFSDWRSQGSVLKFKPGLALNKGSCRQWTLTTENFCVKGKDCIIATPSSQGLGSEC